MKKAVEMQKEYNFKNARRGAVVPPPAGKARITIRLDNDVLDWFRNQANRSGGGQYQSLINDALRHYINETARPIEEVIRTVVREELRKYGDINQ